MKTKKTVMLTILLIGIVVVIIGIHQFFTLRKVHSSFENYYAFRGCVQLLEKTNAYGTCRISSGQTIKIVEINNKWYLEGDGPGIW